MSSIPRTPLKLTSKLLAITGPDEVITDPGSRAEGEGREEVRLDGSSRAPHRSAASVNEREFSNWGHILGTKRAAMGRSGS